MNSGPQAQYWRIWCRSCARSVPPTGSLDKITKPTVMADRLSLFMNHIRPRGPRS